MYKSPGKADDLDNKLVPKEVKDDFGEKGKHDREGRVMTAYF
jgi:hypothetical protein